MNFIFGCCQLWVSIDLRISWPNVRLPRLGETDTQASQDTSISEVSSSFERSEHFWKIRRAEHLPSGIGHPNCMVWKPMSIWFMQFGFQYDPIQCGSYIGYHILVSNKCSTMVSWQSIIPYNSMVCANLVPHLRSICHPTVFPIDKPATWVSPGMRITHGYIPIYGQFQGTNDILVLQHPKKMPI